MYNLSKKNIIILMGIVIGVVIVLIYLLYLNNNNIKNTKNNLEHKEFEIENLGIDSNKDIDSQINKVVGDLTGNLDFSQYKTVNDCLKITDKNTKIACLKEKESEYINTLTEYNTDNCKNLVLYKKDCLNIVYYNQAISSKNPDDCNKIQSNDMLIKCKNEIKGFISYENKINEQNKEVINTINKVDTQTSNVDECNQFSGNYFVKCIYKFVKKDMDLRYCENIKDKNYQTQCINDNWNEITVYNLKMMKEKKDISYCDKIYLKNYKDMCISYYNTNYKKSKLNK